MANRFREIESVIDAKREEMNIEARCETCGHSATFDPEELRKLSTRKRYWVELSDIEKRFMVCSQCGNRACKLRPVERSEPACQSSQSPEAGSSCGA
jgi:hypothetical protein